MQYRMVTGQSEDTLIIDRPFDLRERYWWVCLLLWEDSVLVCDPFTKWNTRIDGCLVMIPTGYDKRVDVVSLWWNIPNRLHIMKLTHDILTKHEVE